MTGTITVHALTHTGAVRASNEDAIAVGDWVCAQDLTKPKPFSFSLDAPHAAFIADGMGGHPGGDVASQAAVRFCVERAHAIADSYDGEQLLSDVNRHLYDMMVRGDGPLGMGTTLAGVLVRPDTVIVLNVGDSKVYRMDGAGELAQLSYDDTPGPKLADGRTAAQTTPMLSQTLGGETHETAIQPHVKLAPIHAGDRFLLCSDGLSDLVGPDEITAILSRETDARAVTALFDDAMTAGGKDNVSIVLVAVA